MSENVIDKGMSPAHKRLHRVDQNVQPKTNANSNTVFEDTDDDDLDEAQSTDKPAIIATACPCCVEQYSPTPKSPGKLRQAREDLELCALHRETTQDRANAIINATMAATDSFLHLARPLGPAAVGAQPSTAPVNVIVQPQALFSILDHSLRRPKDQERVIGTLLGHRSEDGTEIHIQNCYAVPHTETLEQVEVDMDYQKQMLSLHLRANPKEVLVGWYATSSELNTFSALIQNFYGQQGDGTWPHPAVHLTVSTEPGQPPEARTYIGAPIGVTAERAADSCSFIPVPHEIKYGEAEKSGLELISGAKDREDRTIGTISDIEGLERTVEYVLEMVERVSNYVSAVLDEEAEPSTALGQFLLNALSLAPKVEPADIERDFNNHVQDVLVVSYLANTIRTQIDLSNRLATAALAIGGGAPTDGADGADGAEGRQQRGNQNRRKQNRNDRSEPQ